VFELTNRARYKDHTGGAEPAELLPLAMKGLLFYPAEEESRFLPNSDKFLPDYMATHPIDSFVYSFIRENLNASIFLDKSDSTFRRKLSNNTHV
jgi:hypothetical protein